MSRKTTYKPKHLRKGNRVSHAMRRAFGGSYFPIVAIGVMVDIFMPFPVSAMVHVLLDAVQRSADAYEQESESEG